MPQMTRSSSSVAPTTDGSQTRMAADHGSTAGASRSNSSTQNFLNGLKETGMVRVTTESLLSAKKFGVASAT